MGIGTLSDRVNPDPEGNNRVSNGYSKGIDRVSDDPSKTPPSPSPLILPSSSAPDELKKTNKKKEEDGPSIRTLAKEVLQHLNKSANRNFQFRDSHLGLIICRLKEVNRDVEGINIMINRQVALWGTNETMREYLRPQTLFQKAKFAGYFDDRKQPIVNETPQEKRYEQSERDPDLF